MKTSPIRILKLSTAIIAISLLLIILAGRYGNIAADDAEIYKELKIFTAVIQEMEEEYVDPVDTKQLIKAAIQGMVSSLDPHSEYLPPDAFEDFQSDTKGEFEGIGIVITKAKGLLKVIAPIEGTPAFLAGVKSGDIIAKIDGESTEDMELWEAVKKMRGKKGTTVTISVLRPGEPQALTMKLTRDVIPITSVKATTLKPGYGYLRVTNFQANTTDETIKALNQLKDENNGALKGLIFDLRDNPGGLLDQAVSIADLFLEEGLILSVKQRNSEETYKAHKNEIECDFPVVTLINGGSASASEIVAGALQDHQRSLLLGTTSFGKGSVQSIKPLGDGSGIKFTVARYYTPSGQSIQAKGIVPDIEVTYKIIKPEDNSPRATLAEKDLKNHLLAEPQPGDDKNTPPPEEEDLDAPKGKYGELSPEVLLTDSQVIRALDALISYEIFTSKKD